MSNANSGSGNPYTGSETIGRLMAGEQAMGLLRAAAKNGLLAAAREPRTVAEIASIIGFEPEVTADVCAALYGAELLDKEGDQYCLVPPLQAVMEEKAPQTLNNMLSLSTTFAKLLEAVLQPVANYGQLVPEDKLTIACGVWGLASSPAALASFAAVDQQMPEVCQLWEQGAKHMELGCGAGRDLLRVAVPYPKTSVLGVDLETTVLDEVKRQARELGITDRVEVRQCDARDITAQSEYDTILWSQMFFPTSVRRETIEVIRKALKPGGYLIMPILPELPPVEQARQTVGTKQIRLMMVLWRSWGLDWLGIGEVRTELEREGFNFIRTIPHQRTPFMLMKPI